MKRLLTPLFLLIALMLTVVVHAANVGPNIDVAGEAFPDRQRVEPSIAVDPHNPAVMVAVAQDLRLLQTGGHRWHGVYRSTDGGSSWSSSLLPGFPGDGSPQGLSSPLHGFRATTDPVVAFDRAGNAYIVGITTRLNLFVAKYTNDGASYSFTTLICRSACADKPWIAVDNSGGTHDGNVYVSFDGATGVDLVFSTDGAQTFSGTITALRNDALSGATVDSQGRVFVSGVSGGRSTTRNILAAVSTDGGLTFNGHEVAGSAAVLPGALPGNQFRVATIPQIASDSSAVYVAWDDFTMGNSNVFFAKSTDGGITWTAPLRVNDQLAGQHFFPTIATADGVVSVSWYDSRLGQLSNGTITGLDVFYASSANGGNSFSANTRVTSTSFNPNIVERTDFGDTSIFIGDYIQVTALNGVAHVVWTDNRNACDTADPTFGCVDQDVLTASITY